MKWGRLALYAVAVFITQAVIAGILHVAVFDSLFDDPALFRPENEEKIGPYMASRVLFVCLFVYIFVYWYARPSPEGAPGVHRRTGWRAGLWYGLIVWLFYSVPMTIGFWSFLRMPDGMALSWIGIGLAEYITSGSVLGILHSWKTGPPIATAR